MHDKLKDFMLRWSNSIWRKYIDSLNKKPIHSLLIIDQATIHINDIDIKAFESKDTEIKFIPKGITSVLQPIDENENNPFKVHIKKRYIKLFYEKNSIEKVEVF